MIWFYIISACLTVVVALVSYYARLRYAGRRGPLRVEAIVVITALACGITMYIGLRSTMPNWYEAPIPGDEIISLTGGVVTCWAVLILGTALICWLPSSKRKMRLGR
jgi:zinc transporter ZupT